MTRLLLLNDNSVQPNWGAQATPLALRRMLADAIPNLEIDAFPYTWLVRQRRLLRTPFGRFPVRETLPLVWRFTEPADLFPTTADDFEDVAARWLKGHGGPMAQEFIAAARRADVVVHNGEHSIYRNSLEGCRALFLLWFARTRLDLPACEINHTAHLGGVLPVMEAMVRKTYPVLDAVTVREPASLANLEALGITNAELAADVVFYLDDETDRRDEDVRRWREQHDLRSGAYFCLSASALPMSAPHDGQTGAVVELVRALQRLVPKGVLVAKDPHCQFLKEVARLTGAVFFGPEHDLQELWPLFREALFVVTGHYHYVIMAAMVGCPFIPLSTNTHKMTGICRHLRWHRVEPFDATWLRAETDGIVAEAAFILPRRATLGRMLRERAIALARSAGRHAERVAALFTAARAPVAAGGK